ncbi:hypothetical protein Bpfe_014604, partial [Biomphalaria pfeifferi]
MATQIPTEPEPATSAGSSNGQFQENSLMPSSNGLDTPGTCSPSTTPKKQRHWDLS